VRQARAPRLPCISIPSAQAWLSGDVVEEYALLYGRPSDPGFLHAALGQLAVHGFLRDVSEAKPLILHDQPNAGRTIIEKSEDYAGDAAFAVILIGP
jgi:hypothetical protein